MTWGLPESVKIGGVEYAIRTDYRAILDICAALSDLDLDNAEKAEAVLTIFYPDRKTIPPEHWQEAVDQCIWFINCGDTGGRKSPRLVDWEQDFTCICGPVNRVLGQEVRQLEYLHWWSFIAAYMEIGDCTFAQIVHVRDRLARGKPLDKQDREWYERNRNLVDFKQRYTTQEKEDISAWGF